MDYFGGLFSTFLMDVFDQYPVMCHSGLFYFLHFTYGTFSLFYQLQEGYLYGEEEALAGLGWVKQQINGHQNR